ncbi:MAG: cytochrome c oxidase subunit II [Cyanobacteria bacterium J083]|nr:MAG: cytochrome c oxidase subunit II [Cyanobacteria bacterium J083]
MKIPSNILTLVAGVLLTLISLWYGQNHGLLPVAASQEAQKVDELFNFMMTISTGLFLLIQGTLVYVIFRFRRPEGDTTDGPPTEGNVPLEIFWTAVPTVIVFILAIYSFEIYNEMGGLDPMASRDLRPSKIAHHHSANNLMAMGGDNLALGLGKSPDQTGEPITVDVNGIQYAWIFTYPQTGIVTGELTVPVNQPIKLNISAGDVLHAFWLPEFRIKQDAIPGRTAELVFTPTRTGDYPIICAELCGAYHGGMKSVLHVLSPDDYNQWLQDNTIAQNEKNSEPVAINTKNMSKKEYLAPYGTELGLNNSTLAQLHPKKSD